MRIFLLGLLLAGVQAGALAADPTTIHRLASALLVAPATSPAPPVVQLPHPLPASSLTDNASGRRFTYRLELVLDQPPAQPLGIFIAKVSLSGQVRLNGHDLGSCAIGPVETLRCAHQPWLLAPPVTLWQAGTNVIEVDVWATGNQVNGLSQVLVGPAQRLDREYHRPRLWLQRTLIVALLWSTVALGVVGLVVAAGRQWERLYLYFGLAAITRGISSLNSLGVSPGVDMEWFNWLFMSARLASVPFVILAVLTFFDRPMPRLERILLGYTGFMLLVLLVGGAQTRIALVLVIPLLLLSIGLAGLTVRWTWQSRSRRDIALLATVAILFATGIHDLWRIRAPEAFMHMILIHHATGAMLLVMGGIIVQRLTRALDTSANLNVMLAERLAANEADLARKHQTILDLERAHARTQERERFLRDLHDGLGSSLSAARLRLEDQDLPVAQVRSLLDECLDDMRLLLATSAPEGELSDALGELRERMARRIPAQGPRLEWDLALEQLPRLPATARLQLLRVLQEALANALRHAGAGCIRVGARYDVQARRLRLTVEDDGRGFASALPRPGAGRGLANMRYRASQLRAALDIDSRPGGTRITLDWTPPAVSA